MTPNFNIEQRKAIGERFSKNRQNASAISFNYFKKIIIKLGIGIFLRNFHRNGALSIPKGIEQNFINLIKLIKWQKRLIKSGNKKNIIIKFRQSRL